MDIQVRIGHLNALLVEDILDSLVHLEIHVPVVLGLHPDAEGVGNGAVAVAAHAGAGGGGQERHHDDEQAGEQEGGQQLVNAPQAAERLETGILGCI